MYQVYLFIKGLFRPGWFIQTLTQNESCFTVHKCLIMIILVNISKAHCMPWSTNFILYCMHEQIHILFQFHFS